MTGSNKAQAVRGSGGLMDKVPGSYPGVRGSNPHPAATVFTLDPTQSRALSWLLLLCG